MAVIGSGIGDYLDPALLPAGTGDIPINPSQDWEITGVIDVPLADGRVAMVDADGVIVGYR